MEVVMNTWLPFVVQGDDLVGAAHEYEALKKKVKRYRTCASIAGVLLIIVIGIWIGIAILGKHAWAAGVHWRMLQVVLVLLWAGRLPSAASVRA